MNIRNFYGVVAGAAFLSAGCAAYLPAVENPDEPTVEAVTDADPASPESAPQASADAIQSRALDACQEAEALFDAGDVKGAVEQLDTAYALMLQLPNGDDETFDQAKQDIRMVIARVIGRVYDAGEETAAVDEAGAPDPTAPRDSGLPLVINEHVQYEIQSFTGREREFFIESYKRSGRYRPMILKKLAEAGLPSQLSWLPLVESGFKINALSHAGAFGLWQFIASTGLRYGLKRDTYMDERLHHDKATDAAIAYLMDLHRLFGDWYKALAAYNVGEGRIQRLQARSAGTYMDFWDLYLLLPRETRRYVPRLLAVLHLVENPAAFGIELPELDAPLADDYATFESVRAVKLADLESALGIEAGSLALFNPDLRNAATPPGAYTLHLPTGHDAEAVSTAVAGLPEYTPPKPKYLVHRVRRGETLSVIARRYRTSVSAIMRYNSIRSAHRIYVGQRLRIPLRG